MPTYIKPNAIYINLMSTYIKPNAIYINLEHIKCQLIINLKSQFTLNLMAIYINLMPTYIRLSDNLYQA